MIDYLPFSPPNILIIDDANANLVALIDIIRDAGYIARPVTSAREAVNAIEALPPSLILMDISMPEVDGYVLCSILKRNVITKDIPVIFISALNSREEKIMGFKVGAVDYIAMPYEAEEVIARIKIHLQMYMTRYELETNNKKLHTIINAQVRKLYEEQEKVIYAITKLIAIKCSPRENHLEHVSKNSKILAMSLQLTSKYCNVITTSYIDAIELAAPLHNIGRMLLGDDILRKMDHLNFEEIEEMKTHTSAGAALLEEMYSMNENNEILKMAIDIARNHHENWDGSGYPEGICSTDIPLSARIFAIVNEYDMLISNRAHDKEYFNERCVEMINAQAGIKFDPDIVKVFNKIHNQLKY